MAEQTKECCKKTLAQKLKTIRESYASFPVIKDIACPVCREIIKIRVYERPEDSQT
jgi:hypothetical protein